MTMALEIAFVVALVAILLILALEFGADSRDGLDWQDRSDWRHSS